jgi:DNA replication regulator SLD3
VSTSKMTDLFCLLTVSQVPSFSASDQPTAFEPFLLLPRSVLPLSWIDVTAKLLPIPQGSLFISNIPTLEDDLSKYHEPIVLVARLVSDNAFYVIERVKRGIYSLCSLGSWIDEGDLLVAAKGWQDLPRELSLQGRITSIEENGKDWRQAATINGNSLDPGPSGISMNIDAAIVFGVDENDSFDSQLPEETVTVQFEDCRGDKDQETSFTFNPLNRRPSIHDRVPTPPEATDSAHVVTIQSPETLFESLRSQYLEALYISKVCLLLIRWIYVHY